MTAISEDELIKALNHPLRREVLRVMLEAGEPVSPVTAARKIPAALNQVAYHCRVLVKRGAIELEDLRPVRGSMEHWYLVKPEVASSPVVRTVLGLEG